MFSRSETFCALFQALTEAASAITAHLGAAATSAEPFAATGDASARTAATPSGPVAGAELQPFILHHILHRAES